MTLDDKDIRALAGCASGRVDLWTSLIRRHGVRRVAEIGVYRGAFAQRMLDACETIEAYHMIDPWRHLDDWNKPANRRDAAFERFHQETLDRTAAHAAKRVVHRGRTTEVVGAIRDESLDFAYIDGDHTLRGIVVDLVAVYGKVRPGGLVGGDDFARTIWQHGREYEPTLVFPVAVHFAEAMGVPIYALPHTQFLIVKDPERGHSFADLTGRYDDLSLLGQLDSSQAPGAPPAATETPAHGAQGGTRGRLARLARRVGAR